MTVSPSADRPPKLRSSAKTNAAPVAARACQWRRRDLVDSADLLQVHHRRSDRLLPQAHRQVGDVARRLQKSEQQPWSWVASAAPGSRVGVGFTRPCLDRTTGLTPRRRPPVPGLPRRHVSWASVLLEARSPSASAPVFTPSSASVSIRRAATNQIGRRVGWLWTLLPRSDSAATCLSAVAAGVR